MNSHRTALSARVARTCIAAALAASVALAGCSSDDADDDTAPSAAPTAPATEPIPVTEPVDATNPPAGDDAAVVVEDFAFSVGSITAGKEFSIVNADAAPHTFSHTGGAFGVDLPAGATATLTIAEPGEYEVVCLIHSTMNVTFTVS